MIIVSIYRFSKEEFFSGQFHKNKTLLNYKRYGNGNKKIILLHGLLSSSRYWERDMDNLVKNFDILIIDILGFGNSPKPKGSYDLKMHISAIETILTKEQFYSKDTIIVGHSFGAILTLGLSAKYQKYFNNIILIGLPVIYNEKNVIERLMKSSLLIKLSFNKKIAPFIHYPFSFMVFFSYFSKFVGLPSDIFIDINKHTWSSIFGTFEESIMKTNLTNIVPQLIHKHILFIHGKKDITALYSQTKSFSEKIPKSKFITFNNGDHHIFLDNPEKIWKIINNF